MTPTTNPQPGWDGGFMGSPQPTASPDSYQPGSIVVQAQPEPAPAPAASGPPRLAQAYDRFEIPRSVVERSQHWKGTDSDRIFGLREPTGGEATSLSSEKVKWDDAVPRFIVMVGDRPVTDYTQALAWWNKLPAKARSCVTGVFMQMVIPDDAEGESLFASRTRVG